MKNLKSHNPNLLLATSLLVVFLSNLLSLPSAFAQTNQPPLIEYQRLDNHYPNDWMHGFEIGKEAIIRFSLSDPNAGDLLTFNWENLGSVDIFIEATISPNLPYSGTGPYTVEIRWTPQSEETDLYHYIRFTATDQHGAQTEYIFTPYPYFQLEFMPPTEPVKVAVGEAFSIPIAFIDNGDWWESPYFNTETFRNPYFEGYETTWSLEEEGPYGTQVYYVNFAPSPNKIPTQEQAGLHTITVTALDQPLQQPFIYGSAQFQVEVDPTCSNQALYWDQDSDGYGAGPVRGYACSEVPGFVANNLDCSPAEASVHPGAEEIPEDGVDNNCNGVIDEATSCAAMQSLKLWAACSENASLNKWLIYNPNSCPVEVSWEVHKSDQRGTLQAMPGETHFTTLRTAKGPAVTFISWQDVRGKTHKKGMAAAANNCKDKGKNKSILAETSDMQPTMQEQSSLYPMPFQDQFSLRHPTLSAEALIKVSLIGMDGRSYDASICIVDQAEGWLKLDTSSLPLKPGLYFLSIELKNQSPIVSKVMKQ